MRRTFLTKTARSQKQSIAYFRDPFALVPVSDLAEIADKEGINISDTEMDHFKFTRLSLEAQLAVAEAQVKQAKALTF